VHGVHHRCAHGVAERGVGDEDAGDQESCSKQPDQHRPSDRAAAAFERLPKRDGEGEHESPADEEVGHLHPASVAGGQLADVVPPRAVARPREALEQKNDDEEKRSDDACVQKLFHAANLVFTSQSVFSPQIDFSRHPRG